MTGRPDAAAVTEAEGLLGCLEDAARGLVGSRSWRWSLGEVSWAISLLAQVEARLAAVRGRMLVEADVQGLAVHVGLSNLSQVLAARQVMVPAEAARRVKHARLMFAGPYRLTGQALAAGQLSEDHAQVIVEGMEAFPDDLPFEMRGRAEQELLGYARQLDRLQLKKAVVRLREQLTDVDCSPGGDDPERDGRTGEHSRRTRKKTRSGRSGEDGRSGGGAEADGDGSSIWNRRDPEAVRKLTFIDTPDGTTVIRGELDVEGATLVRTALDALSAPTPVHDGQRDPRSPARRRADALVEFVRRALSADVGPSAGGTRPHLNVTVDLDTLLGNGHEPAMTDWGLPLPLDALRRLACDGQVTRIVLGPDSVPLDVGRAERIVPPQLRRSVVSRDKCCTFPFCDRPPSWCECHHVVEWAEGGCTKLGNLVLLCPRHHGQVHREKWQIVMEDGSRPSYIPPAFIDPQRRPRRNPYCQPPPDLFGRIVN